MWATATTTPSAAAVTGRAVCGRDVDAGVEVGVRTKRRLQEQLARAEWLCDPRAGNRPRKAEAGKRGAHRKRARHHRDAGSHLGLIPGCLVCHLDQLLLLLLEQRGQGCRHVGRLVGETGLGRLELGHQRAELGGDVVLLRDGGVQGGQVRRQLGEHAVLGAQRRKAGGVVSLQLGHVGLERGLEVVRALARHDQVGGGDKRVVEVAGSGHRDQQ